MAELLRGTVTFLFTDIEGSTRLVQRLRDRYPAVLAEHERLLRAAFEEHGGQVIDTQGDAFFVAFPRAKDAVEGAIAAQHGLRGHEWPEGGEVRVRMGLHTGEPVAAEGRYTGLGVHRAARICAAGHGGQVLLSSATRELVEDDLSDGVALRDLGEQRLKDLPRAERVYQLVAPGLDGEFPALRTAQLQAFAGREGELAEEAQTLLAPRWYRRRSILTGALAGVVAAAVAIPIFALAGGGGGEGGSSVPPESVALLDSSLEVVRDIDVPGNPGALAVGEGAVWVAHSSANTVSKISLDSNEVNDSIPVGGGPAAIAAGGGAVWVANALDGSVSRLDPVTGRETRIPVGNGPAGITYGEGAVWVVNAADRTVSKIHPVKLEVLGKPLAAGAAGPGIAVGADAVWVTDQGSNTVIRIDVATRTRRVITVGNGPAGIAFDDGAAWVANTLDGTVSKIDAATNSTGALTTVGSDPTDVAVTADSVWVANEFDGRVARLDPATGDLIDVVQTGSRPAGIAASGESVWLSTAAAAPSHRGGTLRVQPLGLDDTIDPAIGLDTLLSMTNDGLVAFRRTGGSEGMQLVPDLATSLPAPTDGGRTYTFQVRSGVRYSTGTPVRASDFRWAIERAVRLGGQGGYFQGLVGARECRKRRCDLSRGIVVDDNARTVTFRLTAPDPDFFYKLALPPAYAVPKTVGPQEVKSPVPATGPYMIDIHRPNRIRLVRNPRFRPWSHAAQPGGYPDVIDGRGAGDQEASRAVGNGTADVSLATPPPEALATLTTQHPGQLYVNPLPQIWAFGLNTRVPPFDRLDVRRALNYAVDRAAVTRLAGGGATARPTCQILPANFQGYERYCPYRGGLAKARDLVARSRTRGTVVRVWTTPAQAGWLELGRYAVSVLQRLGYRASLKPVANPDRYFQEVVFNPRRQAQVVMFGWQANWPSDFFLPNFGCDSYENAMRFCDPAVDAAMNRALRVQASDPLAANELWSGVDRQIVDAAPWVPLVNPAGVNFVAKRVGNYQYNPMWGVLLDQLWVK